MDPLTFWLLATGGVSLALLLTRPTQAATAPVAPTPPPPSWGEAQRVALAVPAGWRRATSAEITALPELISQANILRSTSGFTSMPYGTLSPFTTSNGQTYATWIEQHYHEPGGTVRPWGYHHGVTLLARTGAATLNDEWPGVQPPRKGAGV
jgi:hypothetical protein